MLKIKDNVDLKELEKFGFKYIVSRGRYELSTRGYTLTYINVWNRAITVNILSGDITNDIDIFPIYDLIKADLVEKVEE